MKSLKPNQLYSLWRKNFLTHGEHSLKMESPKNRNCSIYVPCTLLPHSWEEMLMRQECVLTMSRNPSVHWCDNWPASSRTEGTGASCAHFKVIKQTPNYHVHPVPCKFPEGERQASQPTGRVWLLFSTDKLIFWLTSVVNTSLPLKSDPRTDEIKSWCLQRWGEDPGQPLCSVTHQASVPQRTMATGERTGTRPCPCRLGAKSLVQRTDKHTLTRLSLQNGCWLGGFPPSRYFQETMNLCFGGYHLIQNIKKCFENGYIRISLPYTWTLQPP